MGTVGYMPPEQVRGQTVDQRSDIFAVGAIVYEMLSGKRAFHCDTTADTINAILSRDPAPLLEAHPGLSPAVERIVQRCLEKNPNERFHSVRDVAFAFEAISDLPSSPASGASGFSEMHLAFWRRRSIRVLAVAAVVLCLGAALLYHRTSTGPHGTQEWEQLTSFADSVTAPALSPDGRMLAFVRSAHTFIAHGDVYVKMLPHGEPVQLTKDDNLKTNPVFSPDGSRIAYTTAPPWDTWVVPTLGGKAQVMLPNASGLTWIDDQHLLFSEIKGGVHMAVVTATESRSEKRDIYVPAQQEGMAHRSSLSPDHKWVLVATEMDIIDLKPCHLVPFDGSSAGTIVGPPDGLCTFAGWSTDGKWMFFSATTGHGFHLWRQRFPDGKPEQFTFGPTEEEGIAVAPDGHSLLTAVGLSTRTVTVHNESGERPIPFEGQARLTAPQTSSRAIFSPDGSKIYFLGQRGVGEPEDLWVEDLASGVAERAVPGISVSSSYDVSPDGKEIALDSRDPQGVSHIWLASLDHRQSRGNWNPLIRRLSRYSGLKASCFTSRKRVGNPI
jgi:Tol biopolymer transport system component